MKLWMLTPQESYVRQIAYTCGWWHRRLWPQACSSASYRLRNDLYCVEWGVKLYSLTHYRAYPQCQPVNKAKLLIGRGQLRQHLQIRYCRRVGGFRSNSTTDDMARGVAL